MQQEIISKRLKECRIKNNLSQEKVAKEFKVQRQIISYFETGKRLPNILDIIKFAKLYNTSADYLLGLSDVKTVDSDIKFICDYTGLDETAVGILNYYSDYDNYMANVISILVRSEELGIMKDLYYADRFDVYSEVTNDYDEARKALLITNIYNYLMSTDLDDKGYISINFNGKIEEEPQNPKKRNVFGNDEIARVKRNELIEQVLLNKIVDGLKKLKKIKAGEKNGNNTKT